MSNAIRTDVMRLLITQVSQVMNCTPIQAVAHMRKASTKRGNLNMVAELNKYESEVLR